MAKERERYRVGFEGILVPNTVGIVPVTGAPDRGEMCFVTVDVKKGERITVRIQQYAMEAGTESASDPTVDLKKYTASSKADDRRCETTFTTRTTEKRNVAVFFPYSASILGEGEWTVRYRIVVTVNEEIVDDYFINGSHTVKVEKAVSRTVFLTSGNANGSAIPMYQFNFIDANPEKH